MASTNEASFAPGGLSHPDIIRVNSEIYECVLHVYITEPTSQVGLLKVLYKFKKQTF